MLKAMQYFSMVLWLSSCSTMPNGPSVLVLPGDGKEYSQFHDDDTKCRVSAHAQIMVSPKAPDSKAEGQHRYDIDYVQCMYGHGHRVPLPEGFLYDAADEGYPPAAPNLPPSPTPPP